MTLFEVRRGITRTVFLTRKWAIKVPSLRAYGGGLRGLIWSVTRGLQANLSEAEWSGTPGACPVAWSAAGVVNVYPRCSPADTSVAIDWDRIGFLGPVDRKHENVGWLDGQMVLLDYDMSWNDCPHGHPPRPVLVVEEDS